MRDGNMKDADKDVANATDKDVIKETIKNASKITS